MESFVLSETQLNLEIGEEKLIMATIQPADVVNPQVKWECSNPDVAIIRSPDYDVCFVSAKKAGTCTITCRAVDDSSVYAECQVTVDYGYVDLGLPSGTLWSKYNVDYYLYEELVYFPWGDKWKSENDWGHYSFFEGTDESNVQVIKYCTNSGQGMNGITDGNDELLPEDDTATAYWGDNWEMPTKQQFLELIDERYTEIEFTQNTRLEYGVMITSKTNGNSIFLRAAGYHEGYRRLMRDEVGMYWSRTLDTNDNLNAELFTFDSSEAMMTQRPRYLGLSVRPVRKHF